MESIKTALFAACLIGSIIGLADAAIAQGQGVGGSSAPLNRGFKDSTGQSLAYVYARDTKPALIRPRF